MRPHEIRPLHKQKTRSRVGRGNGSGSGTYSGRGMKGQKARSGGGVRPGFEGGQNPQIKGLPMLRGFKNMFRIEYQVVNLDDISRLPEGVSEVTAQVLAEHRLVRSAKAPVKVLGDGEIDRAVQVSVTKASKSAREKIEAAGGIVEESHVPKKPRDRGGAVRRKAARAAQAAGGLPAVGAPEPDDADNETADGGGEEK